jgi:hypothetical protein
MGCYRDSLSMVIRHLSLETNRRCLVGSAYVSSLNISIWRRLMDHLGDAGIDTKIVHASMWTGLIWLGTGFLRRALVNTVMKLRFPWSLRNFLTSSKEVSSPPEDSVVHRYVIFFRVSCLCLHTNVYLEKEICFCTNNNDCYPWNSVQQGDLDRTYKACFPIACFQSYKSRLVNVLFRQCKFIVW